MSFWRITNKSDADTYQRKFFTIKDQLERVVADIEQGEKLEMEKAKVQQQRIEEQEEHKHDPEYQQEMKLEFKTIEEADYIETVIQDRQQDINKISNIMNNIKDIAGDFNIELDAQGAKLEDLDSNMDNVALNTREATKQLKEANTRSRKNGRCLMILAVVIIS